MCLRLAEQYVLLNGEDPSLPEFGFFVAEQESI
jgi:hypothetical protein